jgi:carboxyl-terminal processing protease
MRRPLVALLALLVGGSVARAEDKARLTIASDPADAIVSLSDARPTKTGGKLTDHFERILGRTPLTIEVPAGTAEVVIAKDGYVVKVEPLELQAGAAQRLEVRLTRDVPIPAGISFKDAPPLVKSPEESERLVDMVARAVSALYVERRERGALIEAALRGLVDGLSAVREREGLLRRELSEKERVRFYGEEIDLRPYPALRYSEEAAGPGKTRWSLAAGTVAVEGTTDSEELETEKEKLHAVYAFLKNRWDLSGKLDDSMLAKALVDGLLGSLDDVHTHFLAPDAWKEMGEETAGHFGGVGIVVGAREGGGITVVAPMEGTPAEKAGVKAGDRIVAIDGRSTEGQSLSDVIKVMRGEPGSRVELTLRRGDEPPWKVVLERASIAIKNTKALLLPGEPRLGYLRISTFMSEKLEDEVAAGLDELERKGAQGFVLDLRNNPGGLLQKAVQIADTLVPAGETIVSTRGRIVIEPQTFKATSGAKRRKLPIAILVNEGTASASEILAGTLHEHGLAFLVGEKTFGKGSVQRVVPLEDWSCALALTIATYHLPSGVTPHKKGLEPDIKVALSEDEKLEIADRGVTATLGEGKDRQLDVAMAELRKKLGR